MSALDRAAVEGTSKACFMRLIRAIGVSTYEGVAFMAAFTSSSAMSITVSKPCSPTSARISMMVRLQAAHQSGVPSAVV
eukprot:56158-Pleurochrysis_carterae.AAC.1